MRLRQSFTNHVLPEKNYVEVYMLFTTTNKSGTPTKMQLLSIQMSTFARTGDYSIFLLTVTLLNFSVFYYANELLK